MTDHEGDLKKKLARITARAGIDLERAWADAGANAKRLDSCAGHVFSAIVSDPAKPHHYRRMLCSNCGGDVDRIQAHYYNLGVKHERGRATKR